MGCPQMVVLTGVSVCFKKEKLSLIASEFLRAINLAQWVKFEGVQLCMYRICANFDMCVYSILSCQ